MTAPKISRVMLVACDPIAPAPSGSGNHAIRWGLVAGLQAAGTLVAYYSAATAGKHARDFETARAELALSHLWFDQPSTGESAEVALASAIAEFRPDLLLAYGTEPLRLARKSAPDARSAIMSVDLEYIPALHRVWYDLRYAGLRQKLWALREAPRHLRLAARTYLEVRAEYPKAAFVVNHAAHHARWHARKHGVPVIYTPNPLMQTSRAARLKRSREVPKFVLLGGIGGIATLTGLQWFASKVYPLIEPALNRGEFEVHLIGRGTLDPALDKKLSKVVRRGYVDRIEDVFAEATAILVPTPITVGFRTRIVDAFRHGVTVVAHAANGEGMPELRHGENALVARSPQAFAAAIKQLAADPAYAERLGDVALDQFVGEMNSTTIARKILDFAQEHMPQERRSDP